MIRSLITAEPVEYDMPQQLITRLRETVVRHPWWHARAALVVRLLERAGVTPGRAVLDAGCGWGVTLDALERAGYRATGLDVSLAALKDIDRPHRALIHADLRDGLRDDVAPFDAVLVLDVIEHLSDDHAAISRLADLVRPGGVAIVTVPAMPSLYSEFDVVQGHERRYRRCDLRAVFDADRWAIDMIRPWGISLVPAAWFQRRVSGRRGGSPLEVYARYVHLPSPLMRAILSRLLTIETSLTLAGGAPVGTSLVAVARRR